MSSSRTSRRPPGPARRSTSESHPPPLGFTALASEIKWTPNSIFGPCYGLFADSALSQPDGWWEWQAPPLALGPDSSYHYALHPRESGGDIVVKMLFGGGSGCGITPATICLSMVKFVEASGETTYAEILGGATVFGGDGDCGIAMQSVTPTVVEEGEASTFSVLGGGFSEGTTAHLVGEAEARDATSLVVESPGRLRATFDTRSLVGSAELVVVSASGDSASTTTAIMSGSSGASYDPRTVILWTRPGQLTLPQGEVGSALAYASATPALLAQLEVLGVVAVRSCAPSFLEDPAAAAELADPALLDVFVLDLADTNVFAACEALAADTANVRASHPNWLFTTMDVIPTDQLMPKSWHLRNTGNFPPLAGAVAGADSRAARAWELSTGATPVKVGVIDTGSWVTHPDLAGRYFNLWRSDYTPTHNDDAGHGAPVAGIIAAAGNGGGRAIGVNWSAEIYSLKAGNTYGAFRLDDIIIAITTATAHGLEFVNMSFGGIGWNPSDPDYGTIETAVFNAFHAGVFLAASSGNKNPFGLTPRYPADHYPYVVSVGASLWTDKRWIDLEIPWWAWDYRDDPPYYPYPDDESVWGSHLRFLAPGGRFVPSIRGSSGYTEPDPQLLWMPRWSTDHARFDYDSPWWGFGGTSAAAPVVTGAASLIRSVAGDSLGAEEIAHLLALTARKPEGANPGYQPQTGWGIVDIEQALWAVRLGMRVERGVAIGGTVTDTAAGPIVDLYNFPGLPSNLLGCNSSAYNLRRRVDFTQPFGRRPLVLKRTRGSNGALTIPTWIRGTLSGPVSPQLPRWEPSIDTLTAYADSCVLTTRVWRLYKNGQRYWWPCAPEDARFAYTLVGVPLSALGVEPVVRTAGPLRFTAGPSPTRGDIRLEFTAPPGTVAQIDLLDVQGRRLRDLGRHAIGADDLRLDLRLNDLGAALEPGLYFLRATSRIGSISRRVVVVR